jgi:hypothetical protein
MPDSLETDVDADRLVVPVELVVLERAPVLQRTMGHGGRMAGAVCLVRVVLDHLVFARVADQ